MASRSVNKRPIALEICIFSQFIYQRQLKYSNFNYMPIDGCFHVRQIWFLSTEKSEFGIADMKTWSSTQILWIPNKNVVLRRNHFEILQRLSFQHPIRSVINNKCLHHDKSFLQVATRIWRVKSFCDDSRNWEKVVDKWHIWVSPSCAHTSRWLSSGEWEQTVRCEVKIMNVR